MTTMQKSVNRRVGLLLAALLTLGGGTAAAQGEEDPMAFARGARTWSENCARCHNMRDPQEFRDDTWEVIVSHMRIRAGLTGQETRDVIKFLQQSN